MSAVQNVIHSAARGALSNTGFDEDGFLIESAEWNPQLAETLAEWEGISPLGAAHWRVIHFVRDHYRRLGGMPPMRRICRSSELSPEEAKRLFGGCPQVWRIAGLPNPGEEAKAYMV